MGFTVVYVGVVVALGSWERRGADEKRYSGGGRPGGIGEDIWDGSEDDGGSAGVSG